MAKKKGADMSWLKSAGPTAPSTSSAGSPNFAKMAGQLSPMAGAMLGSVGQHQAANPVVVPTFSQITPEEKEEGQIPEPTGDISLAPGITAAPKKDTAGGQTITTSQQITKNFHSSEFRCKGTGQIKVHRGLVERLQKLRDHLSQKHGRDIPIKITSGYRAPEHNRNIAGAAPNSKHTTGEAADIRAQGVSLSVLAQAAERFFGDGGIGSSYSNHVHVDVGSRRRW